jgi:hypothetical protein
MSIMKKNISLLFFCLTNEKAVFVSFNCIINKFFAQNSIL